MGPADSDMKEATILNRIIRWTPNGIEYEADPRQGEKLLHDFELDDKTNGCATPGVKVTAQQVDSDRPLKEREFTRFRGHAARGNNLAADRPDLLFSCMEICRFMSSPTELSQSALKRMAPYLRARPRLVWRYDYQIASGLEVYTDTDWAGCTRTRKCTSGGCRLLGNHILKTWSATQASLALSSGEAEFYGVVEGAGIGLGQSALFKDIGVAIPLRVWTDSSAAIGICGRQGLGKLRHVACQTLWVQQRVRKGDFELRKVKGEVNPADMFTKHLESQGRIDCLFKLFGCELRDGRAASAPALRREAIAGLCKTSYDDIDDSLNYKTLDVVLADVPSHDPHLLLHQVPVEDLDKFFPRAPVVGAPLGEADEAIDHDMSEPRAFLVSCASAALLRPIGKCEHSVSQFDDFTGAVNAPRVNIAVPGNRRPSGRARSSPRVRRWLCAASAGGRDDQSTTFDAEHVLPANDVSSLVAGPGTFVAEDTLLPLRRMKVANECATPSSAACTRQRCRHLGKHGYRPVGPRVRIASEHDAPSLRRRRRYSGKHELRLVCLETRTAPRHERCCYKPSQPPLLSCNGLEVNPTSSTHDVNDMNEISPGPLTRMSLRTSSANARSANKTDAASAEGECLYVRACDMLLSSAALSAQVCVTIKDYAESVLNKPVKRIHAHILRTICNIYKYTYIYIY